MKHSRNYEYFYPFDAATPDLDGSSRERGSVGFGQEPCYLPQELARAFPTVRSTGWRPIITSIGYTSIGAQDDYTIRLETVGQRVGADQPQSEVWRQVVLEVVGTHFYERNIPLPMTEVTGNPYGLRIVTQGRQGPSLLVCDWEWGRYVRDYDIALLSALTETHGRRQG